jgi:hypothetical protein
VQEQTVEEFKKSVLEEIEDLVWLHDISYIDAAVQYSENKKIDIEIIAPLLKSNKKFEAEIRLEAENLNYLPKTNRLPF